LPNNIIILVTINKFDPNLVLVNTNKLKPYRFIEDITLQPMLVKPFDLVTNERVQKEISEFVFIKLVINHETNISTNNDIITIMLMMFKLT
jgi:hypothetical protein